MITVRGVPVLIGLPDIRKAYNLEPTTDEYHSPLDKSDDPDLLNHIITRLYVPGIKWIVSKKKSYTFKQNCLKPEAKFWYTFLQSRLLPTLHIQAVSRKRALLLYCILEGKAIDMDEIIYRELYSCIKLTSGNLWFPTLITELYCNAGIIFKILEERLKLQAAITPVTIQRMTSQPLSLNKPQQGPSRATPGPSSVPANDTTLESLSQQVTDLRQQFATLLLRQHLVWRYMAEHDIALAANLMTNFQKFTPLVPSPQSTFEMDEPANEPSTHTAFGSHKRKRGKGPIRELT